MKRDATKVIWRTVVFAGAMLGTPACGKKQQPQTTPQNTPTQPAQPTTQTTPDQPATDPAQPPDNNDCRVRGCDEDGGGGAGRGFILS